jgi:phage shock protein PspC (stress-responsive transcriptional regulator)
MSSGMMRLIFILSCLLPGTQLIVYIVLWALLPNE